jgi:hypothetical protein
MPPTTTNAQVDSFASRRSGVRIRMHDSCDESSHGLHLSRVIGYRSPRPSAGAFLLVAPVVAVGVDVVVGDELVGCLGDDVDGGGADQDEDFGAGVGDADAEVVYVVGVAQGEFAAVID